MARDKGSQVASRLDAFRAAQAQARIENGTAQVGPVIAGGPVPSGAPTRVPAGAESSSLAGARAETGGAGPVPGTISYSRGEGDHEGRSGRVGDPGEFFEHSYMWEILHHTSPVRPWVFLSGMAALVVGTMGMIGEWYGVLGHAAQMPEATVATIAVLIGIVVLWQRRVGTPRRVAQLSAIVGALLIGLFSFGAAKSVVLHGKVYAATSITARSWALSHEMRSDIEKVGSFDVVLSYPYALGETHYLELAPGVTTLQGLAQSWAGVNAGSLPNYRFIKVAQDLATAASYGANALTDQQQYLSQDDTAARDLAKTARENMDYYLSKARSALSGVDNYYGFSNGSGK